MGGEMEFGTCEICGRESYLTRTSFKYDIKCECHSPYHFDLFIHCAACKPTKPKETKVILKTESLREITNVV